MKTKRPLLQLCLLAAGWLALVGMSLPAAGQSCVVTNAADSGPGSGGIYNFGNLTVNGCTLALSFLFRMTHIDTNRQSFCRLLLAR